MIKEQSSSEGDPQRRTYSHRPTDVMSMICCRENISSKIDYINKLFFLFAKCKPSSKSIYWTNHSYVWKNNFFPHSFKVWCSSQFVAVAIKLWKLMIKILTGWWLFIAAIRTYTHFQQPLFDKKNFIWNFYFVFLHFSSHLHVSRLFTRCMCTGLRLHRSSHTTI